MRYKTDWAETKGEGWKVVSVHEAVENGQVFTDCSVNKVNKQGQTFPGFDDIAPGYEFEADLWVNPTNQRKYLFAPKPKPVRPSFMGGGAKTAAVEKAMERKEESIKTFQGNKEFGIKVASTMRDVTLITLAMVGNIEDDKMATFAETFERVKTWYLEQWGKTERLLDVPF